MKKFFCFIFTIIISILFCLLCISYGIKEACVNTISNSLVKGEITSKIILSVKKNYKEASYDILEEIENEIGNNPAINKLTDKYFDEIINSVTTGKKAVAPNTKKELLSLIDENEYVLKKHGIEVTDYEKEKVIDEIVNSNALNDIYEKVTVIVNKNLNENQKKVANLYKTVISKEFRYACYSLVIFLVILIMIMKKSFYKFSINLGIAGLISGIIITFILPIIVNMIGNKFTSELIGESANININKITNMGYIFFIISALFIIIYFIGNKLTNYNDEKYVDENTVV